MVHVMPMAESDLNLCTSNIENQKTNGPHEIPHKYSVTHANHLPHSPFFQHEILPLSTAIPTSPALFPNSSSPPPATQLTTKHTSTPQTPYTQPPRTGHPTSDLAPSDLAHRKGISVRASSALRAKDTTGF